MQMVLLSPVSEVEFNCAEDNKSLHPHNTKFDLCSSSAINLMMRCRVGLGRHEHHPTTTVHLIDPQRNSKVVIQVPICHLDLSLLSLALRHLVPRERHSLSAGILQINGSYSVKQRRNADGLYTTVFIGYGPE
jgi:hypothetical protein